MTISGRRRFSARPSGRRSVLESNMKRRGLWSALLVFLALAPAAPAQQTSDPVERALNTVRQLGGQVIIDEKSPGQPVLRVDLNGPRVTDSVVAQLRAFGFLRTLFLCETKVTDAGLANLRDLNDLRVLYLTYGSITDRGLEFLAGLKNLEELGLSYTDITDAGLQYLAKFRKLRVLSLSHTAISDAGLARLKGLAKLEVLYLDGTLITKAGLEHLKELPLQRLSYSDTKAAVGGVDGFRKPPAAPETPRQ
jgi:hypothetical protein